MNYESYLESIKDIPVSDKLIFKPAWLMIAGHIPMSLSGLGNETGPIIKIPSSAIYRHTAEMPVVVFNRNIFKNNENITDIIIPSSIHNIPEEAFSGCTNLKNIVIPATVTNIRKDTFSGCLNLQNVYYGGTMEQWNSIHITKYRHEIEFDDLIPGTPVCKIKAERMIHLSGNDPLLAATIHFRCTPPEYRPVHTPQSEITVKQDRYPTVFE